MNFIRAVLADLRLAYVPKVGAAYRYSINGPFDLAPALMPKALRDGHVLYEIFHAGGHVSTHACSFGTFASMCKEA